MEDDTAKFFEEVDSFINTIDDKDFRPLAYIEQQRIDIERSVLTTNRQTDAIINGIFLFPFVFPEHFLLKYLLDWIKSVDVAKEESIQSDPEIRHKARMEQLSRQVTELNSTIQSLQQKKRLSFSLLFIISFFSPSSQLLAELDQKRAELDKLKQQKAEQETHLKAADDRFSFDYT